MRLLIHLLRIIYRYAMNVRSRHRRPTDTGTPQETDPLTNGPCTQCKKAMEEIQSLRARLESVSAALRDKEVEVQKWKKKESEASYEVTILRSQRDEARGAADRLRGKNAELTKDAGGLQMHLSQMEVRTSRSEAHAAELERALAVAQDERRKTAALLETKGAELREAHAYLNKLDDTTDSEVLALVEKLNSTIFQTAAVIADGFQTRYQSHEGVSSLAEQVCARLERSGLLNVDLGTALRFADHSEDSVLVQTTIQAVLASYARWLCATWDFRLGEGASLLHSVYVAIRETGKRLI